MKVSSLYIPPHPLPKFAPGPMFQHKSPFQKSQDLDFKYLNVLFGDLNAYIGGSMGTNSDFFDEKMESLHFLNSPKYPGQEISGLLHLMHEKLKKSNDGISIEENLKNLSQSIHFERQGHFINLASVLTLLVQKGPELLTKKCLILKLLKFLIKTIVQTNHLLADLSMQRANMMNDLNNLREDLAQTRFDFEEKKHLGNMMALRSFTLGMAEMMDQDVLKFQRNLSRFDGQFKKRISHLERRINFCSSNANPLPNDADYLKSKHSQNIALMKRNYRQCMQKIKREKIFPKPFTYKIRNNTFLSHHVPSSKFINNNLTELSLPKTEHPDKVITPLSPKPVEDVPKSNAPLPTPQLISIAITPSTNRQVSMKDLDQVSLIRKERVSSSLKIVKNGTPKRRYFVGTRRIISTLWFKSW